MSNIAYGAARLFPQGQEKFVLMFEDKEIHLQGTLNDLLSHIPNILQQDSIGGWETYSVQHLGENVIFYVKKRTILTLV